MSRYNKNRINGVRYAQKEEEENFFLLCFFPLLVLVESWMRGGFLITSEQNFPFCL